MAGPLRGDRAGRALSASPAVRPVWIIDPLSWPSACASGPGVLRVHGRFAGAGPSGSESGPSAQPSPRPASNSTVKPEITAGRVAGRVERADRDPAGPTMPSASRRPPFTLRFDQKANHATLLGLMKPGERRMALPCVLHLPDMGSVRITCNARASKLDYDARRRAKPAFVRIAFPPATASQRHVEYRFEVVAIYPQLPGIENEPALRRFPARLSEHLPSQPARADARQQRLQRPGAHSRCSVFRPRARQRRRWPTD